MTDNAFLMELKIRSYMDQIGGYPLGHPKRANFHPIVTVVYDQGREIDRAKTLASPCYRRFSIVDRALLLDTGAGWRPGPPPTPPPPPLPPLPPPAPAKLCTYCGGTGEVAESSTRYMPCPKCRP